mgnify:CR=1 FL=1
MPFAAVFEIIPKRIIRNEKVNYLYVIVIYLSILNLVGLLVMWLDKAKAQGNAWRIPEKSLFLISLIGGSIGTWAGMYIFRHKTKHWYFVAGLPVIFFIQLAIAIHLTT